MFTVEMEHDETAVTLLDNENNHEDVIFNIFDDIVYIRQWDDLAECFNVIVLSPEMFDEFISALASPEGSYTTKKLTNNQD